MARHALFWCVLLVCGCGGRRGTYVVAGGGAPGDAAAEGGSGGSVDAGSDTSTEAEAGTDTSCIDFCATALSMGCANDVMNDCLATCDGLGKQFPDCASSFEAENSCAATQPKSSWYCDQDGFAALDQSYCQSETSAYNACLHAHYP